MVNFFTLEMVRNELLFSHDRCRPFRFPTLFLVGLLSDHLLPLSFQKLSPLPLLRIVFLRRLCFYVALPTFFSWLPFVLFSSLLLPHSPTVGSPFVAGRFVQARVYFFSFIFFASGFLNELPDASVPMRESNDGLDSVMELLSMDERAVIEITMKPFAIVNASLGGGNGNFRRPIKRRLHYFHQPSSFAVTVRGLGSTRSNLEQLFKSKWRSER